MRFALLLATVLMAGCASSRPPGTLAPPTTLAEANAALLGREATVHYSDGRVPERAVVHLGPFSTWLRDEVGRRPGPSREVPTASIAFIEIDDSQTRGQGARRGAGVGAIPGGLLTGYGVGVLLTEPNCAAAAFSSCQIGPVPFGLGLLAVAGGSLAGAMIGSETTAKRYPVIVYQAPLSRYPDAAPAQAARADSPIFIRRAGD